MTERLKVHASKACVRYKRTVGSNPTLSVFFTKKIERSEPIIWLTRGMRSEGAMRRTGPVGGIPLFPFFLQKKSKEVSQ